MSETQETDLRDSPVAQGSAGQLLRAAREKSGLHVAAVAVALKVPVRKIEALEADRFDELGDAVFVRALAGSVCRQIRTDAAPILALLPGAQPAKISRSEGPALAAVRPGLGGRSSGGMWASLPKPVVGIVVALLLGAVALALVPRLSLFDAPSVPALGSSETNQSLFPPAAQPLPSQPGAVAMGQGAATEPVPTAAAASAAAPQAAASFVAVTPAAPTVPGAWITFTADKGDSWVEATSATGAVLIRRTLKAGEAASIAGTAPVKVTIGQAPNTTVTVRDKAFDTTPFMRQDVARFTLN
jgi:cytoskeleton protein RodZ